MIGRSWRRKTLDPTRQTDGPNEQRFRVSNFRFVYAAGIKSKKTLTECNKLALGPQSLRTSLLPDKLYTYSFVNKYIFTYVYTYICIHNIHIYMYISVLNQMTDVKRIFLFLMRLMLVLLLIIATTASLRQLLGLLQLLLLLLLQGTSTTTATTSTTTTISSYCYNIYYYNYQ